MQQARVELSTADVGQVDVQWVDLVNERHHNDVGGVGVAVVFQSSLRSGRVPAVLSPVSGDFERQRDLGDQKGCNQSLGDQRQHLRNERMQLGVNECGKMCLFLRGPRKY